VPSLAARFDEQELVLERDPECLELNDIGQVRLEVADALPFDDYTDCVATGAFLLIDPNGGNTLAAGQVGDTLSAVTGDG
jgi:sulfate adenylyltransferase subunit 1